MLSDANVPVRFRAQQRTKYSLPQLTADCIALYKVSPTLYQTDLRITNNRRHQFPLSLTFRSFKTRIQWSPVLTATVKFSKHIFSTPAIFKATSELFGSQGCSDGKNRLDISSIFSKIRRFAVQFRFRCKFSFHEKRRLSQV